MNMLTALTLGASLVAAVPPAWAQESLPPGWLERRIAKEAARLAAEARREKPVDEPASTTSQPSNWSRVVRLKPGLAILVELPGAPPVGRRFVWADDAELIVVNLDHPHLSDRARRTLLDAVATRPDNFRRLAEGFRFLYGTVRVAPDGIYVADQKVAETADVVHRIPRPDVLAIVTPPHRRGSVVGAVGGGIAGGVIGFYVARRFIFSTRRDAGVWMALSLVGFPLGGALLGSQVEQGVTQRVIYRAP